MMFPAVGCRFAATEDGPSAIQTYIFYPTPATPSPAKLGPYDIDVAMGAPLAAGRFPLVVISHGTGSTPLAYRTLGHHLAGHGFVVALPIHPGNNREDDSAAGTVGNLIARPNHLRTVIDWAHADPELGPSLLPTAAIIGHSMGGYTALALAGGTATSFPRETPDGASQIVQTKRDPRIGALVLLAPATPWFRNEGALRDVDLPILMRIGEKDMHTPSWMAELVLSGVADRAKIDFAAVTNAGHFSFLSPFPPERVHPSFPPSQDPAGFDRVAYHQVLYPEIEIFLRRWIS